MVVSNPCSELTAFSPVFIKRKQPVPYVFLLFPASKQHCPNNAACWSPATPAIGIGCPRIEAAVCPYISEEAFTSGSMQTGISNLQSSSSSQQRSWMLYNMVREALVTSVAKIPPLVSLYISHVSTVPKRTSPLSAFSLAPGTLSSIHLIFVALKYASIKRPVVDLM